MRQGWVMVMAMLGACSAAPPAANTQMAAADAGGKFPDNSASSATDVPAPGASDPAATPLVVALAGDGLQLVDGDSGKTYSVPFGTEQGQTIQSIGKAQGPISETGVNEECGAGPIYFADFSGTLTLVFQDRKFAGWSVGGSKADSKLTTIAGIGVGSTRKALEAAYSVKIEESTIGTEFLAGDLSGLLDGAGAGATVSHLWAGVTCIAR